MLVLFTESFKRFYVEPDSMHIAFLLVSSLLLFSLALNHVYAQEPVAMEQVTPNGKVKVQLFWPEVLPDALYDIELRFLDTQTNEPITKFWIVYSVVVMQNNETIEVYGNQRADDGKASFEVVFPEEGTGAAQVIVVITAMGSGPTWANMKERVVFDVQVVPEFPAVLTIIIALPLLVVVLLGRKMNYNSIKFS